MNVVKVNQCEFTSPWVFAVVYCHIWLCIIKLCSVCHRPASQDFQVYFAYNKPSYYVICTEDLVMQAYHRMCSRNVKCSLHKRYIYSHVSRTSYLGKLCMHGCIKRRGSRLKIHQLLYLPYESWLQASEWTSLSK